MIDPKTKVVCACPLNGRLCVDGVRDDFPDHPVKPGMKVQCRWWQHVYGKDPQSEEIRDEWDCAVAWLPVTTLETSQMARQTSASVDKAANEMRGFKTHVSDLGKAIDGVGKEIRAGIESGALHVFLPPPSNGNP